MTALPPPRTEPIADAAPTADAEPSSDASAAVEAGPAGAPPRGGRRSLALMLLLTVLGAAVVLLATGRTWARGGVAFQSGLLRVSATGSETSGLPGALALVGLASAVALFAVRGPLRKALGLLLALAGAGVVAAAVAAATGTGALDAKAARAVGLTRATATGVSHTGWPWAAALGGVLLLLAGLLVVARGRDWPGMSSRYDAPVAAGAPAQTRRRAATPGPTPGAETPADLWKALDRGEDPTR